MVINVSDLDPARIAEAASVIDAVFLHSSQYVDVPLSHQLGRRILVKDETRNPLRSFKGRGADYLASGISRGRHLVCASSGNFGETRVIGVCPASAPSMAASWQRGVPTRAPAQTIASGLATVDPIPSSVRRMRAFVDEIVLVSETGLMDAMRLAANTLGALLEPSGAASIAALLEHDLPGRRTAVVLTGSMAGGRMLISLGTTGAIEQPWQLATEARSRIDEVNRSNTIGFRSYDRASSLLEPKVKPNPSVDRAEFGEFPYRIPDSSKPSHTSQRVCRVHPRDT